MNLYLNINERLINALNEGFTEIKDELKGIRIASSTLGNLSHTMIRDALGTSVLNDLDLKVQNSSMYKKTTCD